MKVEYGIPTDKEALPLALGIECGFFRDEGLDLALKVVFGGPEIAAAYDSGALPIGELGSPPALTALAKGARFKIVGSGIRRRALQYFVASPQIGGWAALRGKRVGALSRGSCSYWFGRLVLGANGLDPDRDVELIGLNERYPGVVEMFEDGRARRGGALGAERVDRRGPRRVQGLAGAERRAVLPGDAVDGGGRRRAHACDRTGADPRGAARFTPPLPLVRGASGTNGPSSSPAASAFRMRPRRARSSASGPTFITIAGPTWAGLELAIELQLRLGAFQRAASPRHEITDLSFLPQEVSCATY